ncbi:lysophospholipase [Chitinophaga pendula]|uniref:alpha/beta hydrolase n=1 Tax=Chitinophaga TaxID=79328 RepID=UPI000BB05AF5|nr:MULTISPECIES: alpha/beta fold hydrolase [Chitinophaga]ASZ09534.1 alpha/beta hydrolase [Chitinophaga sp. MD30]UCJ07532.1 lysophospholipase [Chitinophaga pendula]
MRRFRVLLYWMIAFYILVGIGIYAFQETLIFHPEGLPANYTFRFKEPFEEIRIPVNKKEQLSAVLFKAAQPKGILLYFHGNARNINWYADRTTDFTKAGYDVLMMDYRTFGKSTGTLTEEGIYTDALLMYDIARKRFEPGKIILYGRSLGTGVAAQLAAVRDCRSLVLEAPYYSVDDVAGHFAPFYPYSLLLQYRFPTYQYLPKVTAPVTIFHGTDDHTVPYSSGKQLEQFFKKGDTFVTIQHGHHNDLATTPQYQQRIKEILQ